MQSPALALTAQSPTKPSQLSSVFKPKLQTDPSRNSSARWSLCRIHFHMSPVWVPADVVPVLDLFYWPVSHVRRCPAVKLLLKFTSQQRWHYITHTSPTNRSRNFPSFVYEVSLFISLNIFHEIGADKHAITIAVNFSVNALINYSKISENCLKIYCQNQINIPNLWILIVDVYNPCLVRRLLVSLGLSFLWSRPHKKAVNKIDRRLRFSEC